MARLTAVPGFSATTLGGIVAYSNELKERELGVPAELIAEHGAVSAEVAEAMAHGARERLGVDVSVAVTGIAGPGGGTEEKPVGLVYFHAVAPDGRQGLLVQLSGRPRLDPPALGCRRSSPRPAAPDAELTQSRDEAGSDRR